MVTISSNLRVEDALQRLDRLLSNNRKSYSLVGARDGNSFVVMRTQSLGNSVLRPQLSGNIEPTVTGCSIIGDFAFCQSAKTLLTLWFAGVSVWTVTSALVALHTGPESLWILPAGGIAMTLIGVLFVRFAKSYYASDRAWIVKLLSEELGN